MPSPEEIDKRAEQVENWIDWLVKRWMENNWRKRFTLLLVLRAIFAFPPVLGSALKLLGSETPGWWMDSASPL